MTGPGYRTEWCVTGQHGPGPLSKGCPGVIRSRTWPDPARKGSTYTTPERVCTCWCHTRPNTKGT